MSKKAKWIWILAICLLGFVGIPTLWLHLESDPTGIMGIIFLFMFGIYPLLSLVIGAFSGSDIRAFWFAPFLTAFFFIPYSIWLLNSFVPEVLIYEGIYLAASFAAMGLSHSVFKILKKRKEDKAFMERKANRKNREK